MNSLPLNTFQPIAAIATTPNAAKRLQPLCQSWGVVLWVPESLDSLEGTNVYRSSLKEHLATLWPTHKALIFSLATGAVVRLIAPLLQHKSQDPAVVVLDELGKFVISLCSSHQGQADQLTRFVALQLGATPVLTGAATALGLPGIDTLGVPFGWKRGRGNWTGVSATVARGEHIQVVQEVGSTLWQSHLPLGHSFEFTESMIPPTPLDKGGNEGSLTPFIQQGEENFLTQSSFEFTESTIPPTPLVKGGKESSSTPFIKQGKEGSSTPFIKQGKEGSSTPFIKQGKEGSSTPLIKEGKEGSSTPFIKEGKEGSSTPLIKGGKGGSSGDQDTAEDEELKRLSNVKPQIWISAKQRQFSATDLQIQWHPRVLWVGVGCERNTPKSLIESAIQQVLADYEFAEEAIAGVATIDIKGDEVGLVELCNIRNWPLRTFSSHDLKQVEVPNPSDVVQQEVGTPSVAEAAALLAAGVMERRRQQTADRRQETELLVTKQIYRSLTSTPILQQDQGEIITEETPRIGQAVTVAIAQSPQEYIGRGGELFLIGTGPGQLQQMTPAAQTAIAQADVVIGYSLYLDLISPLLRPGQIVQSFPITQERQRAERAIELANWGLTVAVVSSGDCGIYGMAGLVFEELRMKGWDGKTPKVQVFPGISALQAAASRVGAPLMHDFCAISLSDLLTPWDVIQRRLRAAASADFVCALYNPKSRTRTEQLKHAQSIFLEYRNPQTPVAIVRSAYREDEEITLTTLEHLMDVAVDMLTTVLIGNESTAFYENWMITPRGYLGFC